MVQKESSISRSVLGDHVQTSCEISDLTNTTVGLFHRNLLSFFFFFFFGGGGFCINVTSVALQPLVPGRLWYNLLTSRTSVVSGSRQCEQIKRVDVKDFSRLWF